MAPSSGGDGDLISLALKLCLAGDQGVGKTALVRRFVSNTFDEGYTSTLGAKVSSRKYTVQDPEQPGTAYDVAAAVWDVMGQASFREALKDAFFARAQGVLLVCDATRAETLHTLPAWSNAVRSVAGQVPAVVLLNKWDLAGEAKSIPAEVKSLCASRGWRWLPTSAKTGENVEEAFRAVAEIYIRRVRVLQGSVASPG